jgi:hypothetical protein
MSAISWRTGPEGLAALLATGPIAAHALTHRAAQHVRPYGRMLWACVHCVQLTVYTW